jgi:hypothetical protein
MNIEIQQRACEFLQLLDQQWVQERQTIFEPMPFKGDENMLVDTKDRAALDADEGDDQLLLGLGSAQNSNPTPASGEMDLDAILGGSSFPSNQNVAP